MTGDKGQQGVDGLPGLKGKPGTECILYNKDTSVRSLNKTVRH